MAFEMNKEKEHNKIIKKFTRLKDKEAKLSEEFEALKEICPHPYLRYRNCGSSGNWDRDDSYWREWYCPTCTKRFRTSQDMNETKPLENRYPHAVVVGPYNKYGHLYQKFYHKWFTLDDDV